MEQRNVLGVLTQKGNYQISNQIHETQAKCGKIHYTKTRLILFLFFHLIRDVGGANFLTNHSVAKVKPKQLRITLDNSIENRSTPNFTD